MQSFYIALQPSSTSEHLGRSSAPGFRVSTRRQRSRSLGPAVEDSRAEVPQVQLQVHGTTFDIDLSEGEFDEYDESGGCPVSLSKLEVTFKVVKKQGFHGKTRCV
ncbi:hypothetical protein ACQ4PT_012832 [Festuca glaucescens]